MAEPTPIETILWRGVEVHIKRDDLNHPIVQGNKQHKLKHNLNKARKQGADTLVTFGGAYSNHLVATAYMAKKNGYKVIGIVRGDELKHAEAHWSDTLKHCRHLDMQLEFVSRADYRQKQHSHAAQAILSALDAAYIIPEGGSNAAAVLGVAEWLQSVKTQLNTAPSHIICPVGTGGTLAGIIMGSAQNHWHCQLIGVAVLKGLQGVNSDINQWLKQTMQTTDGCPDWTISSDYCGSGYAKLTPEMKQFAVSFKAQYGIGLDKIYNVKSFYALDCLIKKGQISSGHQPLIIHTGGLQGGIL